MKKMDVTNIRFLGEEKALCEHNVYTKEQVVKSLEAAMVITSGNKKIKKTMDEEMTSYQFIIDDMEINIQISKRFEKDSEEYINKFDAWIRKDKRNLLKKLKLVAITSAISIGATTVAYEPLKEGIGTVIEAADDLFTDEVGDLENELQIHSGYAYTPDGRNVIPYLDHGCILDEDKTLSVEEKIKKYCEENNLEYMTEIALEKWYHLINEDKEFAETINLKKVEKEYKEKQKSKN